MKGSTNCPRCGGALAIVMPTPELEIREPTAAARDRAYAWAFVDGEWNLALVRPVAHYVKAVHPQRGRQLAADIYAGYTQWAPLHAAAIPQIQGFCQVLVKIGLERRRTAKGAVYELPPLDGGYSLDDDEQVSTAGGDDDGRERRADPEAGGRAAAGQQDD